jgi:hypothetical protein
VEYNHEKLNVRVRKNPHLSKSANFLDNFICFGSEGWAISTASKMSDIESITMSGNVSFFAGVIETFLSFWHVSLASSQRMNSCVSCLCRFSIYPTYCCFSSARPQYRQADFIGIESGIVLHKQRFDFIGIGPMQKASLI